MNSFVYFPVSPFSGIKSLADVSSCSKQKFHLFATTGDVCKRPHRAERAYRKINETVQHFILYLVLSKPGIYLREIVCEVNVVLGLDVTKSACSVQVPKESRFYTPQTSYICPPKG